MLGMGPVTIAVDSYGPVTDNAQSVYELSLIEDDKEKLPHYVYTGRLNPRKNENISGGGL
jgi:hypothetical protein